MKAGTKFRIITITLYCLQILFAASAIYAWVLLHAKKESLYLYLLIFFIIQSFVFYSLGVMYRREIGVKLQRVFDNDLVNKLNRKGRRRLKNVNKRRMKHENKHGLTNNNQ